MMGRVTLVLFAAVLLLLLTMVGCTRIGPGHVGIEVSLAGSQRGVQDFTIKTGWLFYNRFVTSVLEYPTFVQTAKWTRSPHEGDNPDSPAGTNEEISFNSAEGMNVTADISLSYHLVEEKIPHFYVKFRNDDIIHFTHGFLRNVARDAFNDEGGHYKIEEIIGAKKEDYVKGVRARLQNNVSDIGVVIDQLGFIESPRPPQSVTESINAKVQATQLALQKQNELIQAQAEANKTAAYADGDARAVIIRAKAQAEANRMINESLSDRVLERTRLDVIWHAIDKWNGQRPNVEGSGSGLLIQIPK
jgi:regulator of protease activity HflC (stomatin/prohibitin superfamily)